MEKLKSLMQKVPRWGYAAGVAYIALSYAFYRLGNYLSVVTGSAAYAREVKIPVIDDMIPLIPVFVIPYIFSYVFWIMGPIAVSRTRKSNFVNYIAGLTLAYVIGFIFFWLSPTYIDRTSEGLLSAVAQPGLMNRLLGIVYAADGSRYGFNLFPSYHCLISIYCWLGVRNQPEIPKSFQYYSLIMALVICLSTVFTKQHYIVDVFGGVGIALLCYMLMNRLDPGSRIAEQQSRAGFLS